MRKVLGNQKLSENVILYPLIYNNRKSNVDITALDEQHNDLKNAFDLNATSEELKDESEISATIRKYMGFLSAVLVLSIPFLLTTLAPTLVGSFIIGSVVGSAIASLAITATSHYECTKLRNESEEIKKESDNLDKKINDNLYNLLDKLFIENGHENGTPQYFKDLVRYNSRLSDARLDNTEEEFNRMTNKSSKIERMDANLLDPFVIALKKNKNEQAIHQESNQENLPSQKSNSLAR